MRTLIVASMLLLGLSVLGSPTASAHPLCVEAGATACLSSTQPYEACATAGFGLQGAGACVRLAPLEVQVCSTLYVTGVGNCPTDLIEI